MKQIPFDNKTQRIERAINQIITDAVISDRFRNDCYVAFDSIGADLKVPYDEISKGHLAAIDLMAFDQPEHANLRESLTTAYYQLYNSDLHPEETCRLVRDSWEVIIREHHNRKAV